MHGPFRNSLHGNRRFRKIVDQKQQLYFEQGRNRETKNAIVIQVMQSIHAYGGRFLEMTSINPLMYAEVSEKRAKRKCGQRLREGRPRSEKTTLKNPLQFTASNLHM